MTDDTPSLATCERLARDLAEARERLSDRVSLLRNEQRETLRRHRQLLRTALARVRDVTARLREEVQASPASTWMRPRTRVAHGIRFGVRKGGGRLDIADRARTVALIDEHYPELAEQLIDRRPVLVRSELRKLPARVLARIGVTLEGTADEVVVAPTQDDLDRLVAALQAQDPELGR